MKRKKVGTKVLVVLVLILSFSLSYMAGIKASGTWHGLAKEKAAVDLEAIANGKYVELVENFETTMQQAVDQEVANVVNDKRVLIEQALEDYFTSKLDALSESAPFLEVKEELDQLAEAKISYYQQILDTVFGY